MHVFVIQRAKEEIMIQNTTQLSFGKVLKSWVLKLALKVSKQFIDFLCKR